jgi:YfiH family protein
MRLIEAPGLAAVPGLRHAFFTRQGGVSEGLFASLNMGRRSGDDPRNIAANRARAAAALGFPSEVLVTALQVHSPTCISVREPWTPEAAPEADALATDRPGILLGVLTADCGPVLLADREARVIGAAHAGWKGALGGVLESVLEAMTSLGARPKRVTAVIGPAIAQASYEVGPELALRFQEADPASPSCFAPVPGSDRLLFDLKAYAASRLRRAGVEQIETLPHDTAAEEDLFFSYRRTTRSGERQFGIQLSAIGLVE